MFLNDLEKFIRTGKKSGEYPVIRDIQGPSSGSELQIDGRKFITFSTNNYLGLAQNQTMIKAAQLALSKYGVGPASARLMSGNLDIYEELERKTADYLGFEACVSFPSGYMANVGTIAALARPPYVGAFSFFMKSKPVLIISDELNHASIIDGCRLSKSEKAIFKHNDMESLEAILKENKDVEKFIIVDGVYSMEGDIAPLDKLVELKKKYNAALMVDDAHGTGVLGKTGRGTFEHFNLKPTDIDILMGTYVKAFGSVGGFICCNQELADYLKVSARSYVFSIAVPASCAAATIEAIKIMSTDEKPRKNLIHNISYLYNKLTSLGFTVLGGETAIMPIIVGDEKKCIQAEEILFKNGILAPCVRYPAVTKGKSRIRVSVSSEHTQKQMDYLVSALKEVGEKTKIIK